MDSGLDVGDCRPAVSQLEANVDAAEPPRSRSRCPLEQAELTLDELREAGPLRGRDEPRRGGCGARLGAAVDRSASRLVSSGARDAGQRGAAPVWRHDVVRVYPHDPDAFTQGLLSPRRLPLREHRAATAESSLRKVELETGKVVQRVAVGPPLLRRGAGRLGHRTLRAADVGDRTSGSSTTARRSSSCAPSPTRARAGDWPTTARAW